MILHYNDRQLPLFRLLLLQSGQRDDEFSPVVIESLVQIAGHINTTLQSASLNLIQYYFVYRINIQKTRYKIHSLYDP